MTTALAIAIIGLLGWGAEAASHEVTLAVHQVSSGPVGDGVCPQ